MKHTMRLAVVMATCLCVGAETRDEKIDDKITAYIRDILTNHSCAAKTKASQALAEIGDPSMGHLVKFVHQVTDPKSVDYHGPCSEYIIDALSAVRRRVGAKADRILLAEYLTAENSNARAAFWEALYCEENFGKLTRSILDAIRQGGKLTPNSERALEYIVRACVDSERNEQTVEPIIRIFDDYKQLAMDFPKIQRMAQTLSTVGVPTSTSTFTCSKTGRQKIEIDEQTEFFIKLPMLNPDEPLNYHWGFGKVCLEHSHAIGTIESGLLYLGETIQKNEYYLRFLAIRPCKTTFNIYETGGLIEENLEPTYRMQLVIRKIDPAIRRKRIEEFSESLDGRKKGYALDILQGNKPYSPREQ